MKNSLYSAIHVFVCQRQSLVLPLTCSPSSSRSCAISSKTHWCSDCSSLSPLSVPPAYRRLKCRAFQRELSKVPSVVESNTPATCCHPLVCAGRCAELSACQPSSDSELPCASLQRFTGATAAKRKDPLVYTLCARSTRYCGAVGGADH